MQRISPLVLLITATLTGCASLGDNSRLNELERAVERAQATADDALRQAHTAQMKADEAMALIKSEGGDGMAETPSASTREIAEQALKEAQAAKKEAALATKRAERMFKMSIGK